MVVADLADHDAIAAAAEQLRAGPPIGTFHNNAGILLGEARMSRYGIEMHAQVNTIAPYLFGRLLHDVLVGGEGGDHLHGCPAEREGARRG